MPEGSARHRHSWAPATRAVHGGLPPPRQGEPPLPGPALAAPFHLAGDPDSAPYFYTRFGNPTWTAYEQALGELEDGEATLFASGMAALCAVLLPLLSPGDVLVAPSDGYPGVRDLARERLAPLGVEVRLVPTDDDAIRAAVAGASLVWLETPTNPGLDCADVAALAAVAHDAGALVAVDNTLATPLDQRPLDLGADVSVCSGTKALSGHGDLMLGHVAARDPELVGALRAWRTRTGSIPGPFDAWLGHRSLATLDVRLERQCSNAQALAETLAGRDEQLAVRYPGLPGDPAHAVAARQMRRFGSVLTFTLPDRRRAERFLESCELVHEATSFGGVRSSAERRARWRTDTVPEGLVRLSAGCEAPSDLLDDVVSALEA